MNNSNFKIKKILFCIGLIICLIVPTMFLLTGCDNETDPVIAVISIEKTDTTDNEDTYTITYSDGTEDTFVVKNGDQGIQGIQGIKGNDGHTPTITIGENGNWFIDGVDSTIKAQGNKGDTGNGIVSIVKTSTSGLVDTYTITFTDSTTTTFTVTNGEQGIQGIQGIKGNDGHTPIITIGSNGNWYIDGIDTKQKAQGIQGLSAYELYKKNNPDYTKTEQEWLNDLASGHLAKVTINFDTNQGSSISSQTISFGTYASYVEPTKDGYIFDTWTLNGSDIDINTFTFFTDSTLVAKYTPKQFDITLNADGGNVEYNTTTIRYGENYTLPTPTKDYKSFANWSLGEVVIPNSGIWTYSKTAVQIKAVYNSTKIYANLSVDSNYGSIDTTREKLTVGETYTLPIPTIVENGLSFQGWFNGNTKYTDKNGQSLGILLDTDTITLTANFYTEINDVHQIIAMGSAESTTGNFVVTRDLDFAGLEMTPIQNFSGVFDGGGFTLSNITINKGTETNGGFFGSISNSATIIRNIKFDNLNHKGVWDYSGGIVGKKEYNSNLEIVNINISNSFNNSENITDSFGMLCGSIKGANIENINITNSGTSLSTNSSFGLYYGYNVKIDTYKLNSNTNFNNKCYGLLTYGPLQSVNYHYYWDTEGNKKFYTFEYNNCSTYIEITNFTNNIDGLRASISPIDWKYMTYDGKNYGVTNDSNINVSNSSNFGDSEIAWGWVNKLENCIASGTYETWGAKTTNKCIDVSNEYGTYLYNDTDAINNITNSIILFENADGSYYYFTSGGQLGTIDNITLITKELFISLLSIDETIWDLDNFDLSNSIYPSLRSN